MAETTTASSASARKNIVILGGSYGGVSIAHYLLKHALPSLPESDQYQVVLVSNASKFLCRPACPRALISDEYFDQEKLLRDIPGMFRQYPKDSFRFVHGSATSLDNTKRVVDVSLVEGGVAETIEFYALLIATGAATPSPLHGIHRGEKHLRESWEAFRAALPAAKSIVIAGGGPTGVETAGELGEHLNGRAGILSSKLDNPKVAITLVTAGDRILGYNREAISAKAEKHLAKLGVTVLKNTRVTTVEPLSAGTEAGVASKATVTLDSGKTVDADLYIPSVGTTPNTTFVPKILLSADGRVETNVSTLRVDNAGPRIYAVGDASTYSRPAIHQLLEAIPVLGNNMKRDLLLAAGKKDGESGVPMEKAFKEDTTETQLVPIGRSTGVGAAKGWSLPGLMIWLIKGRDYWLWTMGGLWSGSQWNKEA